MANDYSKLSKEELLKVVGKLESRKKYGLIWDEERTKEQFEKESENALPVLKEVKGKEIKTDPSKPVNILIEGDNYHALSVLNYTHQGKIDVIYIDPPYNTGAQTWRYNNDFVDKDDSFRHSKWLSFMNKRLRIAYNLLPSDGFEMAIADKPVRYIREYLTKKGYRNRNGNYFSAKLIRDILRNRVYTGKLVWNRCHYDKTQATPKGYRYIKNDLSKVVVSQGRHQPLVSVEVFEQAQKALAKRRIEHKKRAGDYPLSAVMFCAKCNHKYHGISSIRNHRTGEKSRWYRCIGPYKSFIKCSNKAVKAEDIEPKVSVLLSTLLRSDRLKPSRWKTVTDAIKQDCQPIDEKEQLRLQNKLKKIQKKQSKLTDIYLENVLGEDVYHDKIIALRKDEEELKKQLALQALREIERERSIGYINRVKDFLEGYDDNKEKISFADKKELAGLLFKNIKIAPAIGGSFPPKRICFSLFPPFNFLFSETERKMQCQKNQKLTRIRRKKHALRSPKGVVGSTSVPSDVR
ncbi:MAG: recombinase family protein [Candidatus Omnitrophota bacterium]